MIEPESLTDITDFPLNPIYDQLMHENMQKLQNKINVDAKDVEQTTES